MSYNKQLIELLELVYGKGFLSVGGEASIKNMFNNIPVSGKSILDFGCGVGGAEFYLARKFDCNITAFDISELMIREARERFKNLSYKGEVNFIHGTDLNTLSGQVFDMAFTKETFLHIKNKKSVFKDIYKLTTDKLILYEWFRNGDPYSLLMKKFLKFDGLDIFLITPEKCKDILTEVGFKDVLYKDCSVAELTKTKAVIKKISGPLFKNLIAKYSENYVNQYCIPSWQMQAELIQNEELLVGKIIATK